MKYVTPTSVRLVLVAAGSFQLSCFHTFRYRPGLLTCIALRGCFVTRTVIALCASMHKFADKWHRVRDNIVSIISPWHHGLCQYQLYTRKPSLSSGCCFLFFWMGNRQRYGVRQCCISYVSDHHRGRLGMIHGRAQLGSVSLACLPCGRQFGERTQGYSAPN